MIRAGSQLIFCSPDEIRRKSVVELNDQNIITRIFSLNEANAEPEHTLFFNGILSAEIISLKQNTGSVSMVLLKDSMYLDLSMGVRSNVKRQKNKQLILDFGTNSPEIINILLPHVIPFLKEFSIMEIIAASTYNPSLLLGRSAGLKENNSAGIILWENVDMTKMSLLFSTRIREIS
jgi:hypothetical protein